MPLLIADCYCGVDVVSMIFYGCCMLLVAAYITCNKPCNTEHQENKDETKNIEVAIICLIQLSLRPQTINLRDRYEID